MHAAALVAPVLASSRAGLAPVAMKPPSRPCAGGSATSSCSSRSPSGLASTIPAHEQLACRRHFAGSRLQGIIERRKVSRRARAVRMPSRRAPRSRGLPRCKASRASARAMSGERRNISRTCAPQLALGNEHRTLRRGAHNFCMSLSGADNLFASSRAPAEVSVRSIIPSRLPVTFAGKCFRPAPDCVALSPSMLIRVSDEERASGLSLGSLPFCVSSRYPTSAPAAESSGTPEAAETVKRMPRDIALSGSARLVRNRNSAQAAASARDQAREAGSAQCLVRTTRDREQAVRAGQARQLGNRQFRKRDRARHEIARRHSAAASAIRSRNGPAQREHCGSRLQECSSVSVPGVTNRTTSRPRPIWNRAVWLRRDPHLARKSQRDSPCGSAFPVLLGWHRRRTWECHRPDASRVW